VNVLFIGGTGLISTAVSRLAVAEGFDLYLLNRGLRNAELSAARRLTADIRRPEDVHAALQDRQFDVVVDWIAYVPDDIERDLTLFRGRVGQYIFISSASVYEKPPTHPIVTESTPLSNPYWEYARNKIACEKRLMQAYREEGFPVTVVRPSLTYDTNLPVAIGGRGGYTLADRMKKGKPVIVHGDGSSLWVVTHAVDFGRGFLGLVGNERAVGQAFHITSDEVFTWNQIYQIIAGALGVEADTVHIPSDFIARTEPLLAGSLLGDKTWSVIFDNNKIRSFVPEFRPAIPFHEGIRRTLEWFDADQNRKGVDVATDAQIERLLSAYAHGRP